MVKLRSAFSDPIGIPREHPLATVCLLACRK